MCSTSALVLIEIQETWVKTSWKNIIFLGEFSKSASYGCPVDRRLWRKHLECVDVPKTNEKAMIFLKNQVSIKNMKNVNNNDFVKM